MLSEPCDLSETLEQPGTLHPAGGQFYAGEPKFCFVYEKFLNGFVCFMLKKAGFGCLLES